MKKHVRLYFDYFGHGVDSFIPCEVCGSRATDIHHIDCRGMGGSKSKDFIENLQALCRTCHLVYGDKKQYIEFLTDVHNKLLSSNPHTRVNVSKIDI